MVEIPWFLRKKIRLSGDWHNTVPSDMIKTVAYSSEQNCTICKVEGIIIS